MVGRSKASGKRPWLAALLGTLATGLGHIYLRRWKRGLGWFAVAVAMSALFVPPEAARALLSGSGGDVATLAPLLAVAVASVADAYVLARMSHREARDSDGERPSTASESGSGSAVAAGGVTGTGAGATECPECGKELDPELDFCPWCTTRLDEESKR
ncbi:zinc ribbon domain-containing protein [Halobellus ruber]|uniref:Zinc ribbon domain-containing protein n=1 Tax=Halobellus ruber TaxID=2761102 RepID=A0A7J9SJD3_9EURY|nr:zinc ribbon domain-containing protein [Halobellus ruber]MBB6646493.1 zinc ribbon domain-containing protein [Halobellus ruber]